MREKPRCYLRAVRPSVDFQSISTFVQRESTGKLSHDTAVYGASADEKSAFPVCGSTGKDACSWTMNQSPLILR